MLLLLLLLRFALDLSLFEVGAIGVVLNDPITLLVLLELALLVEFGKQVFGLVRLLGLLLLELEPVLQLPVLLLQLVCPLLLAQLLFFQLGELGLGPPPLRTTFEHMCSFAVRRCTK